MDKHNHKIHGGHLGHKPPPQETELAREEVQVERKKFIFILKENPRGRFIRITEFVAGRSDTVIVPTTGRKDFMDALQRIWDKDDEKPQQRTPRHYE
jgi:PurA ssDNA and RNA-binding protein